MEIVKKEDKEIIDEIVNRMFFLERRIPKSYKKLIKKELKRREKEIKRNLKYIRKKVKENFKDKTLRRKIKELR